MTSLSFCVLQYLLPAFQYRKHREENYFHTVIWTSCFPFSWILQVAAELHYSKILFVKTCPSLTLFCLIPSVSSILLWLIKLYNKNITFEIPSKPTVCFGNLRLNSLLQLLILVVCIFKTNYQAALLDFYIYVQPKHLSYTFLAPLILHMSLFKAQYVKNTVWV